MIGSVIGVQKYVYDIFGPGVNLAARIEGLCGPMEILVSEDTHALIQNEFRFTDGGEHEIRGFGEQQVYRLEGDLAAANDRDLFFAQGFVAVVVLSGVLVEIFIGNLQRPVRCCVGRERKERFAIFPARVDEADQAVGIDLR